MADIILSVLAYRTTTSGGIFTDFVPASELQPTASGVAAAAGYLTPASQAGYDPTGILDQAPLFNALVQTAITSKLPILVPAGIFKFNSSLILNVPGLANSGLYTGVQMVGAAPALQAYQGPGWQSTGVFAANPQTVFIFTSLTAPGVTWNATRGTRLENICIVGPNQYNSGGTTFAGMVPVDSLATYTTAGSRVSQFSPLCGIAIDSLNGTTPSDGGYPGMTYAASNQNGSSNCLIRNCFVQGFIVGVGVGLLGVGSQSDVCVWEKGGMNAVDTCFAFGQTQSRGFVINGGSYAYFRQFMDGTTWGATLQGCPPTSVRDIVAVYFYRLMSFSQAWNNLSVISCYAESFSTLGNWGRGNQAFAKAMTFQGGEFNFRTTGFNPLPPLLLETWGPTSFVGVDFGYAGAVANQFPCLNFSSKYSTTPIKFQGCSFFGTATNNVPPLIGYDFYNHCSAVVDGCMVGNGSTFAISDNDGINAQADFVSNGRLITTGSARRYRDAQNEYIFNPPSSGLMTTVAVSALTKLSSTVTFTATDASIVQVGDILGWFMLAQNGSTKAAMCPALQVTASNTGTGAVTANMLFQPAQYDVAANQLGGGTLLAIYQNHWAPAQALTCTTATSTALTVVSPTTILMNGDWLQGAGIAANSRVVSGGGTANITLNKATTANASGVALFFGRLNTPTVTPTW